MAVGTLCSGVSCRSATRWWACVTAPGELGAGTSLGLGWPAMPDYCLGISNGLHWSSLSCCLCLASKAGCGVQASSVPLLFQA